MLEIRGAENDDRGAPGWSDRDATVEARTPNRMPRGIVAHSFGNMHGYACPLSRQRSVLRSLDAGCNSCTQDDTIASGIARGSWCRALESLLLDSGVLEVEPALLDVHRLVSRGDQHHSHKHQLSVQLPTRGSRPSQSRPSLVHYQTLKGLEG